jgi:hypothetical protein
MIGKDDEAELDEMQRRIKENLQFPLSVGCRSGSILMNKADISLHQNGWEFRKSA